jgi:L-asparaginase / beta-aspartyl-peptidase
MARRLRGGGVGCVERLRNPVRAARKILSDSPHVYFVAEGAERFAAEHGDHSLPQRRPDHPARSRAAARISGARHSKQTGGNDLFAPETSLRCNQDDATISHDGGRGRA